MEKFKKGWAKLNEPTYSTIGAYGWIAFGVMVFCRDDTWTSFITMIIFDLVIFNSIYKYARDH